MKINKLLKPTLLMLVVLGLTSTRVNSKNLDSVSSYRKTQENLIANNYVKAYELYRQGSDYYSSGDMLRAIEAFDQAIAINPDLDLAYAGKGWALKELGDLVKALDAFEQAIKINPDSYRHWDGKGNILYYLGRFEKSVQAYELSLAINPQASRSWSGKGWALSRLNQAEQSLKAFERAIEIYRDAPNYWVGKGSVLFQQGRYQEASLAFKEALLLEPNHQSSQHYLKLIERRLSSSNLDSNK